MAKVASSQAAIVYDPSAKTNVYMGIIIFSPDVAPTTIASACENKL